MSEYMTFPKIYLQEPENSWNSEQIHSDDVEYILATDVAELAKVCLNLVAALDHNYLVAKDSPLRTHARELASRYLIESEEEE